MKDKNATNSKSWVQALKFLAFSLSAGVIQIVSDTIMIGVTIAITNYFSGKTL